MFMGVQKSRVAYSDRLRERKKKRNKMPRTKTQDAAFKIVSFLPFFYTFLHCFLFAFANCCDRMVLDQGFIYPVEIQFPHLRIRMM